MTKKYCQFIDARNGNLCYNEGIKQKHVVFIGYDYLCEKHSKYVKKLENQEK